jgi:hypothetical protein
LEKERWRVTGFKEEEERKRREKLSVVRHCWIAFLTKKNFHTRPRAFHKTSCIPDVDRSILVAIDSTIVFRFVSPVAISLPLPAETT